MRSTLLSCFALLWIPATVSAEPIGIIGETRVPPHTLVRLRADGVEDKAALLWRITPNQGVHRATTPRGQLEFVAPPGTYEIELLVITQRDEQLRVEEAHRTVVIGSDSPRPDPKPDPKPRPIPPDPVQALGRIRFGNAGCTATIIGPRRKDGRWDVVTAAHCISNVGQRGTMHLKDGRTLNLRVSTIHKTPDVAWCVTEESVDQLPYAVLAKENPAIGTQVWHMGYGVDQPGNREEGELAGAEDARGQLRLILSVSSGDSGGGIFRVDTNELVSVVCCTSGMAKRVSMWGGATEVIQRTRPPGTTLQEADDWLPLPIPICQGGRLDQDAWSAHPIPIRSVRNLNSALPGVPHAPLHR